MSDSYIIIVVSVEEISPQSSGCMIKKGFCAYEIAPEVCAQLLKAFVHLHMFFGKRWYGSNVLPGVRE